MVLIFILSQTFYLYQYSLSKYSVLSCLRVCLAKELARSLYTGERVVLPLYNSYTGCVQKHLLIHYSLVTM